MSEEHDTIYTTRSNLENAMRVMLEDLGFDPNDYTVELTQEEGTINIDVLSKDNPESVEELVTVPLEGFNVELLDDVDSSVADQVEEALKTNEGDDEHTTE